MCHAHAVRARGLLVPPVLLLLGIMLPSLLASLLPNGGCLGWGASQVVAGRALVRRAVTQLSGWLRAEARVAAPALRCAWPCGAGMPGCVAVCAAVLLALAP